MMGQQKYLEQVIEDWYQHATSDGISDLMDVSDEREYVKVRVHDARLPPCPSLLAPYSTRSWPPLLGA